MIKHLELFAGIGGFRQAIDLLGKDVGFKTECIGFSEIDQYAKATYKSNFKTNGEIDMGNMSIYQKNSPQIYHIPNFDLLTAGFPCQSFSMMGKQLGFDDDRGNLFFNILNIIAIKKPKFILLENVKNLLTHEKGHTFKTIIQSLKSNGYNHIYYDVFNTQHFSLAQNRNRVFIFATTETLPHYFQFSQSVVFQSFEASKQKFKSLVFQKSILDVLEKKVDNKYYLSEKVKPTILADGSKNFKSNSEINQLIARPLTATMVKLHRACQDNYYSDNFLNHENPEDYAKQYFDKTTLATHRIRKLTPKEALSLQGFDEKFYKNAVRAGVSNHQLYRQAGNAISVNTVYAILFHLFIQNNLLQLCSFSTSTPKVLSATSY